MTNYRHEDDDAPYQEPVPALWMLIMAVFSMAFWVCVIGGIWYGVVKMLGWG